MSQFVFDTKEAALAALGADASDRVRVYEISKPEPNPTKKYVLGTSRDIALARFATEVLKLEVGSEGKGGRASGKVTKKQLEAALQKVMTAPPDKIEEARAELKKLRDAVEAAKAKRAANKESTSEAPPANAPTPPAPVPAAPAAPPAAPVA